MSEKMFPLQAPRSGSTTQPHPLKIPWSVAEKAYSVYAGLYGKSQSLERLAERGGFGGCEMDELYPQWREEVSEITALRTELADAKHTIARVSFYAGQSTGEIRMLKQRVAELEAGIAKILPDFNCRMFTPYHKLLSALLPPDRITHIPGKEGDDGEMH